MTLARRLKERMGAVRKSQAELARDVGVSQQAIGKLVNGDSRATVHLTRIARALGTTAAYLACETDDPAGNGPEIDLTPEEEKLLSIYRELDKKDQAALRRLIEHMQPSDNGDDDA